MSNVIFTMDENGMHHLQNIYELCKYFKVKGNKST